MPPATRPRDVTYPQFSPLFDGRRIECHPAPTIRNGRFQQLVWLGVAGYVVVNHYDRELLLVDPWPSYRKKIRDITRHEAVERLQKLINFLRRGHQEGYRLVGTLMSHEHFDHIRDLPLIYALITRPAGRAGRFRLRDDPIPRAALPPICCDRDSQRFLQREFRPRRQLRDFDNWEIVTVKRPADLGRVRYRDTYNIDHPPALPAGLEAEPVKLGRFVVTPYVWDHLTVPFDASSLLGCLSGHLQRISAFMISTGPRTKRSFLVGSAGEMSRSYTRAVRDVRITCDLLVQSLTPGMWIFEPNFKDMIRYQKRNITVKDFIVCSHFEHFTGGRPASKRRLRKHDFDKVKTYIRALPKAEREKVFVLARSWFELTPPRRPSELALL